MSTRGGTKRDLWRAIHNLRDENARLSERNETLCQLVADMESEIARLKYYQPDAFQSQSHIVGEITKNEFRNP